YQELHGELHTPRSDHLSDSDLPGAQDRPRGGEIHEIAACNQYDQRCNEREAVYRGAASGRPHLADSPARQVNIPKGREAIVLEPAARLRRLDPDGSVEYRPQRLQYLVLPGTWCEPDVAVVSKSPRPPRHLLVGCQLVRPRCIRHDEIGDELRVVWQITQNTRHPKRMRGGE